MDPLALETQIPMRHLRIDLDRTNRAAGQQATRNAPERGGTTEWIPAICKGALRCLRPRRVTPWCAAALRWIRISALILVWPRWSSAQPLSLDLTVQRSEGAEGCAERTALWSKLQRLSQFTQLEAQRSADAHSVDRASSEPRPAISNASGASTLRVSVDFRRIGDEYVADVRFSGAKSGERLLRDRGRDCTSLEDAVVVSTVLLLDGESRNENSAPRVSARAVSTIQIHRTKWHTLPAPEPQHEWLLSTKAGLLSNGSHGATSWFALETGILFAQRWQFGSELIALLPNLDDYGPGKISLSLLGVELNACRWWGRSARLGLCIGTTVGRLRSRGRGFDEDITAHLLWAAVDSSALAELRLGSSWFVSVEAKGWVPLLDQTFSVENLGQAWNSAPVWGGLAARLGVRFR